MAAVRARRRLPPGRRRGQGASRNASTRGLTGREISDLVPVSGAQQDPPLTLRVAATLAALRRCRRSRCLTRFYFLFLQEERSATAGFLIRQERMIALRGQFFPGMRGAWPRALPKRRTAAAGLARADTVRLPPGRKNPHRMRSSRNGQREAEEPDTPPFPPPTQKKKTPPPPPPSLDAGGASPARRVLPRTRG